MYLHIFQKKSTVPPIISPYVYIYIQEMNPFNFYSHPRLRTCGLSLLSTSTSNVIQVGQCYNLSIILIFIYYILIYIWQHRKTRRQLAGHPRTFTETSIYSLFPTTFLYPNQTENIYFSIFFILFNLHHLPRKSPFMHYIIVQLGTYIYHRSSHNLSKISVPSHHHKISKIFI